MWGDHWWNPLLPAPADSPPSGALAPPTALSFGGAVSEKGGLEGFSGAFGRSLSLLTEVMLKRKRDSELGIGDFRLRTPRNELLGAPKGPEDHASGQAGSGALRAPTVRWGGGWKEAVEFSKLRPHGPWPETLA